MKADFHIHTNISDGSDTQEQVFLMAKEQGLTHIAITDHDTFAGVELNQKLANQYQITYIPGLELSAYDYQEHRKCHIVGLYVKPGHKPLDEMIEYITKERHAHSNKQVELLMEMGYKISFKDFENNRGYHGIYKQHIMEVLMKRGYARGYYDAFYRKMFKNKGPLEMEIEYPSCEEAVKAIADSGGIPILAHPTSYKNLNTVASLVKHGLQGIEASYPSMLPSDRIVLEELADKYGLVLSAGSDYHGRYAERTGGFVGSHTVDSFALLR